MYILFNFLSNIGSSSSRLLLFWLSYEEDTEVDVDDNYQVNPWTLFLEYLDECDYYNRKLFLSMFLSSMRSDI